MFTPPPGHPRFPLFDGLRAVAALSVVLAHTGTLSTFSRNNEIGGAITARGNVGVTIFFVISGFLLYRPFVAARLEGRPRPRIGRYFRNRALRIVPAYWFALTVLALLVPSFVVGVFTDDWWLYYGFLQNTSHEYFLGGLTVVWSLCVEVAFYLALPLYAVLSGRLTRDTGRPGAVGRELTLLAVLAIASIVARTVMYATNPQTPFSELLPGTLLWFCLGMGMAVVSASGMRFAAVRWVQRRPSLTWLAAAGVFAIACSAGWPRGFEEQYSTGQWLAHYVLFGLVAALMVAPAVVGISSDSVPARVLGSRLMRWLGLISYGIFLWHLPVASEMVGIADAVPGGFLVYTVLAIVAASACAAFSYYVVERPLLRLKDRRVAR